MLVGLFSIMDSLQTVLVCIGLDCADIKMLNYGIQDAHWMIFRNEVTDTVRKKKRIVLIVRFICYHAMSVRVKVLF